MKFLAPLLLIFCSQLRAQDSITVYDVSNDDFDRMMTEYSNWGRWGDDDRLGTLNLITPNKRVEAARLVKEGISISLSRDMDNSE